MYPIRDFLELTKQFVEKVQFSLRRRKRIPSVWVNFWMRPKRGTREVERKTKKEGIETAKEENEHFGYPFFILLLFFSPWKCSSCVHFTMFTRVKNIRL